MERRNGWATRAAMLAAALASLGAGGRATAQPDHAAAPLVVAIAESPPFAMRAADGSWIGLAVELWREVAAELGLDWRPLPVELGHMGAVLGDGRADVGLGAVAVDAEGEATHDYSQAYYATGLGFAQRRQAEASWRGAIAALASSELLRLVALIAAATLIVGILIALVERRHDASEFAGPWRRGISTGVWWAAVTMTTVGYGDATPKTTSGRFLALLWMFIGVATVAIFTATVTALLTVGSLQNTVRRSTDLYHLRLGAVEGGAGALFLGTRHVAFATFTDYESAFAALIGDRVDAVVANAAALRYELRHHQQWQGTLQISPIVLEPLLYAFGLRNGLAQREAINRSLLRIVEEERWRDVERQYLGHS